MHMHNLLWVLCIMCNLISVSAVQKRGIMALFMSVDDRDVIPLILTQDSMQIPKVGQELSEGLYEAEVYRTAHNIQAMLMARGNEELIRLWHRRLDHTSLDYQRKTLKRIVHEVPKIYLTIIGHCEPCAEGKETREPLLPITKSNITKIIELVHSDVFGPMNLEGMSRSRNFVSLYGEKG